MTDAKEENSKISSNDKKERVVGRNTNSNDAKALRCRVFVGNLSSDQTNKSEVRSIFDKYGDIESISLHHNFGFIQFVDEKGADSAVKAMHGKTLFGRRIDVNLAGLRRRPQEKDAVHKPPSKEEVVPPEMLKKYRPPPQRGRDRSPIRRDGGDIPYGRPAGQLQRPAFEPFNPHMSSESLSRRDLSGPQIAGPPPNHRGPPRPAVDCEIVALTRELSRYAEDIESRLRGIGLVCNIGFPPSELPITELMERIARTGTLYAVVISEQNAQHHSCTLNLLQGTRQEHRNMPLNAALSLVARNFDAFLRGPPPDQPSAPSSYGTVQPPQNDRFNPSHLSSNIAPSNNLNPSPGKQMSTAEIDAMIAKLQREKEQRESLSKTPPDYERRAELSNQIRSTSLDIPGNSYLHPTSQQSGNGTSYTPSSYQSFPQGQQSTYDQQSGYR